MSQGRTDIVLWVERINFGHSRVGFVPAVLFALEAMIGMHGYNLTNLTNLTNLSS